MWQIISSQTDFRNQFLCTQTCNINGPIFSQQDVPRLDIAVNLPVVMEILQTLQHLLQNGCYDHLVQNTIFTLARFHVCFDDIQHWACIKKNVIRRQLSIRKICNVKDLYFSKFQQKFVRGVTLYQCILISQYMKNLYRIAIQNSYRNLSRFFFLLSSFNSCLVAIARLEGVSLTPLYPYERSLYSHICMYIIIILLRKVQN